MNEHIKFLAAETAAMMPGVYKIEYESGKKGIEFTEDALEKFVELIVRECVHVALSDVLPNWGDAVSEANAQCVKIAADLKQHFGV